MCLCTVKLQRALPTIWCNVKTLKSLKFAHYTKLQISNPVFNHTWIKWETFPCPKGGYWLTASVAMRKFEEYIGQNFDSSLHMEERLPIWFRYCRYLIKNANLVRLHTHITQTPRCETDATHLLQNYNDIKVILMHTFRVWNLNTLSLIQLTKNGKRHFVLQNMAYHG